MPPSQLKRLKASLHEKGILGPQKSKKQKKNQKRDGGGDFRAPRHAALAEIREGFNPFDVKALSRPKKFEATSLKDSRKKGDKDKGIVGRPGVTKSFGEESRRATLLPEMNRKHKVGGIFDRRFGENDPTMTPDERMMERFVREKQRKKGGSQFDLEEAEDEEEGALTHAGKALSFGDQDGIRDDFDAGSLEGSSDGEEEGRKSQKRPLSLEGDEDEDQEGAEQPERKKTKTEVMKEVIAKSKLHKYERQQAKEDDEEEREKLDEDLPGLLALLKGQKAPPPKPVQDAPIDPSINPERQAFIAANSKAAEKEFDARVKALARDKRAQPTERTKTEEERAIEDAARLKELEEKRLRRMRGEEEEEDEEVSKKSKADEMAESDEDAIDDAEAFGITRKQVTHRPEGVEDEDDFLLDDDLIGSGSDLESDQFDSGGEESDFDEEAQNAQDDEDDEFIRGLLPNGDKTSTSYGVSIGADSSSQQNSKLAYTYPCPLSHAELLDVFKSVPISDVPTVVQRIRTLYHPQLNSENRSKLASFSAALVDHISYMADQKPPPLLAVVENVIRHLHSLSRQFASDIGTAFRTHLKGMQQDGFPTPGNLVVLTAIGTIYPTSDHFHQVVTPAITTMARWLGLTTPKTASDLDSGAYICTLLLQYQAFSKRYVPELINFSIKALKSESITPEYVKIYTKILTDAADLWSSKSAFTEIFSPKVLSVLRQHKQKNALQRLQILLTRSRIARRPLELHHHRPMPIKTQFPKFEEKFNPDKHYDPNRERAEASKLKVEYKKERKGAIRELRKDANFVARQKLKEKKEADSAYEAKYKKLIASIQSEEGKEANNYEKIKKARKRMK